MRKDAAAGIAAGPAPALLCFDLKPFLAALTVLTLLAAAWQLRPYHSLLASPFSAACPHPAASLPARPLAVHAKRTSTPNSTASTSSFPPRQQPPGPTRREFRAVGSAAALFVQMGAYRGGPYTFAVVGLASKPIHVYGKPFFRCEWEPNAPNNASSSSPPPRPMRAANTYHMLPDWGYGRVYTVVVVNCTFPRVPNADNAGGRLVLYAHYGPPAPPDRHERIVALEEVPGAYDEAAFRTPPHRYDYLYCGSSLYGNLSSVRVREWMAYHARFFGPRSHFVFHDAGGVSPAVRAALEPWVRAGRATLQDVRAQAEYDGWYYNQFLVVNDCLHRFRHAAKWTFFFDVDEYIFLPDGRTLEDVLAELEPYTQFTIEQNPMSSRLCVRDPSNPEADYSNQWGFEKLVFRNSITGVRRDRKYAIQAKNAYATGVHMSENVIGNTTHKTEHLIRYYHYHNTINVLGEVCHEFVSIRPKGGITWSEKTPWYYDDSMKRVANAVREFERKTIGNVRV
ncbi:galactan beta-1,4-galactosyltransferase GALS1-like [Phragmites australis]|uniref:galactan beta-1,4-galactosyltransferase GALS1-like n=1 Tax=Phragmites australis TaxID=29695 RepID=UPI002D7786A4|nr:galactan beta-1,4-galactosyltransferase GALS1-like [Phragmites australis]